MSPRALPISGIATVKSSQALEAPDRSPALTQTVAIKRLPHHGDLPLPSYQTTGSAGMDLTAAIGADVAAGACAG